MLPLGGGFGCSSGAANSIRRGGHSHRRNTIVDLPLEGRNFYALTTLVPESPLSAAASIALPSQ